MFNYDYVHLASVSFWLTMGVIQAVIIFIALFSIVNYLVNTVFGKSKRNATQWVFKVLPPSIKSMKVSYDKHTQIVTATAIVLINGKEAKRSHEKIVPDIKFLKEYTQNVQLELMDNLAKENKICPPQQ